LGTLSTRPDLFPPPDTPAALPPFSIIEPRTGLGADCGRILAGLPQWFGIPDDNAAYVRHVEENPTWSAATDDGTVVGILDVICHFAEAYEVHVMAVDSAMRGVGIGSAMLSAAETSIKARGGRLLEVKILGFSDADEGYAGTRAFYIAQGFVPMEELDLWGPDNPALILVKPLEYTQPFRSRLRGSILDFLRSDTEHGFLSGSSFST
jgi:GNAT superfamily N-acetyltransferase